MHSRLSLTKRGAISIIVACLMVLALALMPVRAFADEQMDEDDFNQFPAATVESTVVEEPSTETIASDSGQEAIVDTSQDTEGFQPTASDANDTTSFDSTGESSGDGQSASDQPADLVDDANIEPGTEEPALSTGDVAPITEPTTTSDVDDADAQALEEGNQAIAESLDKEEENISVLASPGESIPEGDYIIEAGIEAEEKTGLVGLVLDAHDGVSDGAQVVSWKYKGKDSQKWHIKSEGDGWYSIAAYSDHSLVLTATGDSGRLYLTKYKSGLASQLWCFVLSGTSYGTGYQIMPKGIQKSATNKTISQNLPNKAIDVRGNSTENGSDIITYTKSDTVKGNQTYYLVNPKPVKPTSGLTGMEGKYHIQVPTKTSVVVEIRKASSDNGANVWLYTSSGKTHQDVYLQHEGNGFYSMWIMGTKKVLDVRGSSILPGTNIIQWAYKGSDNQLWAVRKNDDGTYSFINKATGLVLGAAAEGTASSGKNIAGAQDNGRANNGFTLARVSLVSKGIYKIMSLSDSKVLDVSRSSTENGASLSFYTDNGGKNQRFELVSAGKADHWRIRTASSGGWVTHGSDGKTTQQGNHATAINDRNTWHVVWREGDLMLICDADNHVLGGSNRKVSFVSAPITLGDGLYMIDAKLSGVVLDVPGASTESGVKINVYPDKNADNQKFLISKYGSGYKIVNVKSALAMTASGTSNGSKIIQSKFTGDSSQIWTLGIADGGYVRLINSSSKKALDISGTGSVDGSKSTATRVYTSTGEREARQSWKPVYASGWYKASGHWKYQRSDGKGSFDDDINTSGNSLGNYDILHEIWSRVQGQTSNTKYLIATSWDACYVGVFTGAKGNWVPYLGFNCGNGNHNVIEGKVKEKDPTSTWQWDPRWNRLLAVNNVPSKMPALEEGDAWARNLGTTWETSRVRRVNAGEQWFTSISWTLGFHTTITSNPKGELGRHVSNGCIRLEYKNAQWIYEHIAPGTRCIQMRT